MLTDKEFRIKHEFLLNSDPRPYYHGHEDGMVVIVRNWNFVLKGYWRLKR